MTITIRVDGVEQSYRVMDNTIIRFARQFQFIRAHFTSLEGAEISVYVNDIVAIS